MGHNLLPLCRSAKLVQQPRVLQGVESGERARLEVQSDGSTTVDEEKQ
jgi:hypothetical protein